VTGLPVLRVILVDDHPVVREGFRSMLVGESIDVVAEAGCGADAVRLAQSLDPDVVVLDLQLPDMDGVAVLREIKKSASRSAVLVVSMHDDPAMVRKAMRAGASGYLLKGVTRKDLLGALRAVSSGTAVLDPAVVEGVLGGVPDASRSRADAVMADALTVVERRVLRLVADGLTNREIGERMQWSIATAKKYVQRTFEKLNVSNRAQAVASGIRRGLLE